jgi:hypothetical protein
VVAGQVYQMMTSDWVSIPKGTVRSTAFGSRLRACPTPICCLLVAFDGSIDHRVAYRSTTLVALETASTVNNARS